ncbi:cupin 2 conserved barrel domain protein [Ilyonectria robusta]
MQVADPEIGILKPTLKKQHLIVVFIPPRATLLALILAGYHFPHPTSIKMPSQVFKASQSSQSTTKVTQTFTGDVYLDFIHHDTKAAIANVTFTPCARTYWHTHEEGQMLRVLTGTGWVCDKGGVPKRIEAGDVVWAAPGTTHWHGADDGCLMTHLVIGIGKTIWHDEVSDEEYGKKG